MSTVIRYPESPKTQDRANTQLTNRQEYTRWLTFGAVLLLTDRPS